MTSYTITPTWAECERAGKLLSPDGEPYDVGRANEIAIELAKARLLREALGEMCRSARHASHSNYATPALLDLSLVLVRAEKALEATR